jgi:small-conductance mechanosensitive channel
MMTDSRVRPVFWPYGVKSREYTGRIVTVSNAKIFDEPVYNYSRDFPYLWEELALPKPITYSSDRSRAEHILLEVAERHTVPISDLSQEALEEMQRRYVVKAAEMRPKVYYRLTDNWLELTVRFIAKDHGIRGLKDAMSRDILKALDEAGIGMASATFEIVGLPPLRVQDVRGIGSGELKKN